MTVQDPKKPGKKGPKPFRISFGYVILAFLILMLLTSVFKNVGVKELPYSEFKELVRNGRVKSVSMSETEIRGEYLEASEEGDKEGDKEVVKDGEGGSEEEKLTRFRTIRLPQTKDEELVRLINEGKIEKVEGKPPAGMGGLFLLLLLPVILLGVLWYFGMRRMGAMGQQFVSFGRSKAKVLAEKDTQTTFDDVAACEEAKEELREIIQYLREPKKFQALGAKVPKGVLLVGPPGTGKTLLARAVAGEAKVHFFTISGSDFVEMFVGVGAARVRDLFSQAKSKRPCIVFIDEIDAVGRHRGAGLGGGHDEREQTLNALLVELDGFEANKGVIIIAATNRPDVLDPALLRPGRFDRQVVLDMPEAKGREAILKVHSRGKPLAPEVDLTVLAKRTPGFTGADLANVMNEAALLTGRKNGTVITMVELEDAIDRVVAGPERKSKLIGPEEKRVIAYHEIGHALTASRLPHADRVHKISIVPRGTAALGYTLQLPEDDQHLISRSQLMDRISVALGGRIAEELVMGDISTGAQNDLERVTDLARSMVCRYGMSDAVGPMALERSDGAVFLGKEFTQTKAQFSPQTLEKIDQEISRVVSEAYDRTREILQKDRKLMDQLAERLMEKEVIDGKELTEMIRKNDERNSRPGSGGEGQTEESR
ncbi:MAG: ATP-dependent zinc metalloprotease FtsH [Planctomycetota bacterium]|nr:ATP-dependent zinc metalloprotease FtsH [Planctomycetota bacterium]